MSAIPKYTKPVDDHLLKSKSKQERQGHIASAHEGFLELPVPVVLGAMWLAGVALMGVGVLALYLFWLTLKGVAGS